MEVIYCVCREKVLLLGIPRTLSWSLKAKPCEEGSILTLHVDGVKDVLLLRGNPVNLFEYRIEVTNFLIEIPYPLYCDEYVDVTQLSSEVRYIEVGRNSETVKKGESISNCSTGTKENTGLNPCDNQSVFYKWNQIVGYLEDWLGAVAVSAWFDDARVTEFTEETLKIEAGSESRCVVILKRCVPYIQMALKELFGSEATIDVSFRNG